MQQKAAQGRQHHFWTRGLGRFVKLMTSRLGFRGLWGGYRCGEKGRCLVIGSWILFNLESRRGQISVSSWSKGAGLLAGSWGNAVHSLRRVQRWFCWEMPSTQGSKWVSSRAGLFQCPSSEPWGSEVGLTRGRLSEQGLKPSLPLSRGSPGKVSLSGALLLRRLWKQC